MKQISTIGLHLAKRVFQVHGAEAEGLLLFNRKYAVVKCCASLGNCRLV